MIFLKITGGLGNQMFQFATAYALAKKNNTNIGIDLSEISSKKHKQNFTYRNFQLDKTFNISNFELIPSFAYDFIVGNQLKDKLKRFFVKGDFFYEKSLEFDNSLFQINNKNTYIEGYFQSEKYFIEFEKEIKKQFTFKQKTNLKTQNLSNFLSNKQTLAIHIRRGDYVNNKAINSTHGTCPVEYYQKALSYFDLNKHHLCFFSDDINWVKKTFTSIIELKSITFVDWNSGEDAWQDMYLMSLCKNFIIANSSFSWWGAWLSKHTNKKIIAPKQWFNNKTKNLQTKDLIPSSWIKI
ncbi:MAG TPA: alpha-1,2-fucosyltransferase [Crocinitomix sp.]|nr:alpha-1,2-fucosyltransferase [Crocinitomix sp.]